MLETCYVLLSIKLEFWEKMLSIAYQQTNYISRLMVDNFTYRKVQYFCLEVRFRQIHKISYLKI